MEEIKLHIKELRTRLQDDSKINVPKLLDVLSLIVTKLDDLDEKSSGNIRQR